MPDNKDLREGRIPLKVILGTVAVMTVAILLVQYIFNLFVDS